MRVHSDRLTVNDFYAAARRAGITVVACNEHGSRSRERAFEIAFSGSGVSGGQWGGGGYKSATWDEWGIALGWLFNVDPAMHCGKNSYQSAEHFHWLTGRRFVNLDPSEQHYRHRWGNRTVHGDGLWASVQCSCGAEQRWPLSPSRDWPTLRALIVAELLD